MSSGQRSKQAATIDAARPAGRAVVVTPTDGVEIEVTRGLYVGGTGNLTVMMQEDSALVLFSNVPVGYHPLQVRQVQSTGTTATLIVALR